MMKSLRILTSVLVAASVFGSCAKELTDLPDNTSGSEIISFGMDGSFSAKVQAKATEVTSLNSFYTTAVTGSAGNESQVWNSVQFNQVPGSSPATYAGDKFWPSSDPGYKFYGSNVALNFAAGGTYVNASNATDVVCAYLSSPTYNTKNTLTFEHIFARLSDVTISAKDGYTITGISLMLTPRTGGTYNLRLGAGQTDASGWSGVTTAASPVNIAADEPGVKSNDLWLVPGGYEVTLSWTATKGNYTKTFSSVLQFVQLMRGKMNSITAVLGGDAKDVQFAVLINEWDYDSPAIVIDKESWKPKAVITVSGKDRIKEGKSQILIITGGLDYSGSVIVLINGVSHSGSFINGKARVIIDGLTPGEYTAHCQYLGNEKYFESDIVEFKFTVSS